jgi:hypothetical protein
MGLILIGHSWPLIDHPQSMFPPLRTDPAWLELRGAGP